MSRCPACGQPVPEAPGDVSLALRDSRPVVLPPPWVVRGAELREVAVPEARWVVRGVDGPVVYLQEIGDRRRRSVLGEVLMAAWVPAAPSGV